MSLDITLDRQESLALYLQISEQIKNRIGDGRLPSGTQLPTVRQLAQDLGVTRLTIQNAYAELQSAGWLEATVGRGTFVSQTVQPRTLQATNAEELTPDAVINDILQINEVAGLRSLASGSPDERLFPTDEFWQCLAMLRENFANTTRYGSSQGDPQLRVELSKHVSESGIAATPDDILVVQGASQGISLVAQVLAKPGDVIFVEEPTYVGLLHALKVRDLRAIPVPNDDEGPDLEMLERLAIQYRPRFFYVIPTFQNPTGRCMSAPRRKALLELSERLGFLLVEDDIYAQLAYDFPPPPSLRAMDKTGSVIHVSSFSKSLMPGLRLGYLVAPAPLHERILSLRRGTDLCSPILLQQALTNFLRNGGLKRHLNRVIPEYRRRRDAIVRALQMNMPTQVHWTEPAGGFCTWLTLPPGGHFDDLRQAALREGWAFAPGEVFLTKPDGCTHMRLCFGNQTSAAIRSGIEVLGRLVHERIGDALATPTPSLDWTPLV